MKLKKFTNRKQIPLFCISIIILLVIFGITTKIKRLCLMCTQNILYLRTYIETDLFSQSKQVKYVLFVRLPQ